MILKVVWKCAVVVHGAQSAMMHGTVLMQVWYVDSLAIPAKVGLASNLLLTIKRNISL